MILKPIGGGTTTAGVSGSFLGLPDVITKSYTGKFGESPRVNRTETGLDFSTSQKFFVTDFGAVADGQNVLSGSVTAGSNVVTIGVYTNPINILGSSVTLPNQESDFSPSDVGKVLVCTGAGPSGGQLTSTITSYINSKQVTINSTISVSVSGDMPVSWGTDNTTAFQTGIDYVFGTLNSGILSVPIGKYLFTGSLTIPNMYYGSSCVFQGEDSGQGDLMSYKNAKVPLLMITNQSNPFIQFSNYVYGGTVKQLYFYHPNQIKSSTSTTSTVPIVYPYVIYVPNPNLKVSLLDIYIVNAYDGIKFCSSRGYLNNLQIGAFHYGIEFDMIYDFVFAYNIEVLACMGMFIEGYGAGGNSGIERGWVKNNGYGMVCKRVDAIQIIGFGTFYRYCGIYCLSTTNTLTIPGDVPQGYGNFTNIRADGVSWGVIIETSKSSGWSFNNMSIEGNAQANTGALWLKGGGLVGGCQWTGGGIYNIPDSTKIKIDSGTVYTLKVRNVEKIPDIDENNSGPGASFSAGTHGHGIGTRNPTQFLDVRGKIRIGDDTYNTTFYGGEIKYDTTSGTIEYHNGSQWVSVIKAWANFLGNGTLNAKGGVTSITRNSLGNYTITFNKPFPDTYYAITGSTLSPGASAGGINVLSKTTTTANIETRMYNGGSLYDPTEVLIIATGS